MSHESSGSETDDAAGVRFANEDERAAGQGRRRRQDVVPPQQQEQLPPDEAGAAAQPEAADEVAEAIRAQEELAQQHGGMVRLARLPRTPPGERRFPIQPPNTHSAPNTPGRNRRVRAVNNDERIARELQAQLDANLVDLNAPEGAQAAQREAHPDAVAQAPFDIRNEADFPPLAPLPPQPAVAEPQPRPDAPRLPNLEPLQAVRNPLRPLAALEDLVEELPQRVQPVNERLRAVANAPFGQVPDGPALDRQRGTRQPHAQRFNINEDPALLAARGEILNLQRQVAAARRSEATQRTLLVEYQQRVNANENAAREATDVANRALQAVERERLLRRNAEIISNRRAGTMTNAQLNEYVVANRLLPTDPRARDLTDNGRDRRPQPRGLSASQTDAHVADIRRQLARRRLSETSEDSEIERALAGEHDLADAIDVELELPREGSLRARLLNSPDGVRFSREQAPPRAQPVQGASAERMTNTELAHQFRTLQLQLEERGIPLATFNLAPRPTRNSTPRREALDLVHQHLQRPHRGVPDLTQQYQNMTLQPADRRHQFYDSQDWRQRNRSPPRDRSPPPRRRSPPRAPPNRSSSFAGQQQTRDQRHTQYDADFEEDEQDGGAEGQAQATPEATRTRRSGGFTPLMPERRPIDQVRDEQLLEEWYVEKARGPSSEEIHAFCEREALTIVESNMISQLLGAEASRMLLITQTELNLNNLRTLRAGVNSLRNFNNVLIRVLAEAKKVAEQSLVSVQQNDIPLMTPLPEYYGTESVPMDMRRLGLSEYSGKLDSNGQPVQDIFSWLMRFVEVIKTFRLSEEAAVRVLRFRLTDNAAKVLDGCLPGVIDENVNLKRVVQHIECHLGSLLDCTVARDLCRAVNRKSGETIFQTLTRARQYAKMAVRCDLPVSDRQKNADQMLIQVVLRNTDWDNRKLVEERQRNRQSQGMAAYNADELATQVFDVEQHNVLSRKGGLRFVEATSEPNGGASASGTVHAVHNTAVAAASADRIEAIAAQCQQISAALQNPAVLHAMQQAQRQKSPGPSQRASRYDDRRSSSRGRREGSADTRWGSRGRGDRSKSGTRSGSQRRDYSASGRSSRPSERANSAAVAHHIQRSSSTSSFGATRMKRDYNVDINNLGLSLPSCFKCGDAGHYMNDTQICPYGKFELTNTRCQNCLVGGHLASNCVKTKAIQHVKNGQTGGSRR